VPPSQSPQEALFQQNCVVCHGNPAIRAPTRASLHAMSPDFIVEALTDGIMKDQGSALSPEQRVSLAEYLTGRKVGA
jgi:polyvinyl alcohol dehydrogenase (cytochrome)